MGYIFSLIFLGLLLLLAELIIFPGFGFSGILGIAALVGSCVYGFTHISTTAGVIILIVNIILCTILIALTVRSKTWKKLSLDTKIESHVGQKHEIANVGDTGVTVTRICPMGTARIDGKTMEVKSAEGLIDPEVEVEVTLIENDIIYVKKHIK